MAEKIIYLVEFSDYDDHGVEACFVDGQEAITVATLLNERQRMKSRDKRTPVNNYSVEPYRLFESKSEFLEAEENGD